MPEASEHSAAPFVPPKDHCRVHRRREALAKRFGAGGRSAARLMPAKRSLLTMGLLEFEFYTKHHWLLDRPIRRGGGWEP